MAGGFQFKCDICLKKAKDGVRGDFSLFKAHWFPRHIAKTALFQPKTIKNTQKCPIPNLFNPSFKFPVPSRSQLINLTKNEKDN